ncbi:MAG: NAD(P)-dependent oxidoreductase [Salinivirgaceae bacterium]|nr:NAD(P)-dependent oxidoreductase [Salinivirgaceae bacterium]MDD4746595.1 NAD(P)-dependent oxidoreductase [Salinivirgaceae bacterium]MDY0280712.1 NAD(P)-dependent oxidoreductase [Salinivirgaceae bacterium]
MKILVATEKPFAASAVEQIKKVIVESGHEFALLEKYTTPQQFKDAAADANAIIVRSDLVTEEIIAAAAKLKIVVRAGAGFDNVDLKAASSKGVIVMNTPGQNSNAVAELVFSFLLHLVRNGFSGTSGTELRGKKLGLHAFGHIGKIVACIANGFGMEVYAYSPSLARNPELGKEHGVIAVKNPEELYDKCEIISLHMPANADTKQSINYDLMNRMPEHGIIVNTARKEVMNEADLVRIMTEKSKFKYATDIAAGNQGELVEKFGARVLASVKKMGAQTSEANVNAGIAAAKQIVGFFKSGDTTFQVNK